MQDSTVLLMTNFPQESSKGLFRKNFRIFGNGKTILSFGQKDADVEKIELNETKAGKHFGYDEKKI